MSLVFVFKFIVDETIEPVVAFRLFIDFDRQNVSMIAKKNNCTAQCKCQTQSEMQTVAIDISTRSIPQGLLF